MDKEILREKIKNLENIYVVDGDNVKEVGLRSEDIIVGQELYSGFTESVRSFKLLNIFSSKDEAEEHIEFGNVSREDKLILPTWKEINENLNSSAKFYVYENGDLLEYHLFRNVPTDAIVITVYTWGELTGDIVFEEPFTKESYTEARREFVKLFKGEYGS